MLISLSPQHIAAFFQQHPPEILTLGFILACGALILLMKRLFGAVGLIVYVVVAVIAANLQVQTATTYSFFPDPIALGSAVFSSTFIVSGILTECYGKSQAQLATWLSFTGLILMTFFMTITMGFVPAKGFESAHNAISFLFTPAPALIAASLIAYTVGQFNDIWIFSGLSRLTGQKFLWLRSFIAPLIGAFLDNFIFSVLAWIVFSPSPLAWDTVLFTYVLGTYLFRVFIAFIGIPFIYIARKLKK